MSGGASAPSTEIAAAKLNLALHVRGRLPDGRHEIETLFAFCIAGDTVRAVPDEELSLDIEGPFAGDLAGADNLVLTAARALREASAAGQGARLTLTKTLPVASGIGGGSADAAAALRLCTALWRIDPNHAQALAPQIGSDVPACLLSLPCRGTNAGERLQIVDLPDLSGRPVLLVNPRAALSTREVFARWDGKDRGPLGDWRSGRNDLLPAALTLVPGIGEVLDWLERREGAQHVRMSGSGATCFAMFESQEQRDCAASEVPPHWWHMASLLR